MQVFKLLTAAEMDAFRRELRFEGSADDLRDGFIHLSAGHQVQGTADKHFADAEALWIVACEADRLGEALRWEPARGGEEFPHLYRPLVPDDVLWEASLMRGPDGRFRPPSEVGP